jgi:hypothetical protein
MGILDNAKQVAKAVGEIHNLELYQRVLRACNKTLPKFGAPLVRLGRYRPDERKAFVNTGRLLARNHRFPCLLYSRQTAHRYGRDQIPPRRKFLIHARGAAASAACSSRLWWRCTPVGCGTSFACCPDYVASAFGIFRNGWAGVRTSSQNSVPSGFCGKRTFLDRPAHSDIGGIRN